MKAKLKVARADNNKAKKDRMLRFLWEKGNVKIVPSEPKEDEG